MWLIYIGETMMDEGYEEEREPLTSPNSSKADEEESSEANGVINSKEAEGISNSMDEEDANSDDQLNEVPQEGLCEMSKSETSELVAVDRDTGNLQIM